MVSLRLTDEEYDRFRLLCMSRGIGSVSQMIRAAVDHMLGESSLPEQPPLPELHVRLATLESRLAELANALIRLETRLLGISIDNTVDSVYRPAEPR